MDPCSEECGLGEEDDDDFRPNFCYDHCDGCLDDDADADCPGDCETCNECADCWCE